MCCRRCTRLFFSMFFFLVVSVFSSHNTLRSKARCEHTRSRSSRKFLPYSFLTRSSKKKTKKKTTTEETFEEQTTNDRRTTRICGKLPILFGCVCGTNTRCAALRKILRKIVSHRYVSACRYFRIFYSHNSTFSSLACGTQCPLCRLRQLENAQRLKLPQQIGGC